MSDTVPEGDRRGSDPRDVGNDDHQTDESAPEPAADAEDSTEPLGNAGNAEAARYRRRLREVEADRDRLTARVDALTRAEVERLAGRSLTDGGDVWKAGISLGDLLGDDGNLDAAKVEETVTAILDTSPHWAKRGRTPRPDNSQGPRGEDDTGLTWQQALGGRRAD